MSSQSDILGFDTRQFSNARVPEDQGILSKVKGSFGTATSFLVGAFDRGYDVLTGVSERVKALQILRADTVEDKPTETQITANNNTASSNLSMITKVVGAVGVIFLISKLVKK